MIAVAALVVIAAVLACFGYALATNRDGWATRIADKLTGWRVDRSPEDQPWRLEKSFRQNVRSQQYVGAIMMIMSLLIAAGAVNAAVHAL